MFPPPTCLQGQDGTRVPRGPQNGKSGPRRERRLLIRSHSENRSFVGDLVFFFSLEASSIFLWPCVYSRLSVLCCGAGPFAMSLLGTSWPSSVWKPKLCSAEGSPYTFPW